MKTVIPCLLVSRMTASTDILIECLEEWVKRQEIEMLSQRQKLNS